jgi:pimeloyl-ACP methyl ester carboxylesterase
MDADDASAGRRPSALASVEVGSSERDESSIREGRVEANGIEFGFLEAGSGPLALCLHGFPDSAHTWRYLLPELARAGFRGVAPFMRGYAPTAIPQDGDYRMDALIADANELHEALGGDGRAVLIGSDWGAEAAYGAGSLAPDRWRRLVTIAVPPAALDERLFGDPGQRERFSYLFQMKTPRAEETAAADGMAFLDRLWSAWSPGYDAAQDLRLVKRSLRDPANLMAAIGYYRAEEPAASGVAPQPTLYLHGDRDGCIDPALVVDAEEHLSPGSRLQAVEGAGHFLQVERPTQVNGLILAWIDPLPGG